jgi:cytochrome P450
MNFFISVLLYFLLTFAVIQSLDYILRRSKRKSGKLPPGPSRLPIVGNLLDLGDKPHKSLAKLAKTHGQLMSLKLGQVTTIVVSSATMAKEVLQKHDLTFCNRTVVDAARALDHHEAGIAWLPVATRWRNLRKICNSHIFTSQKLDANQDLRRKKVQDLLAEVQERCLVGEAVDLRQAAFTATLNALSNTVLSLDLTDLSSDIAREFKEHISCIMDEAGKPNLVDYFPLLRRIDPQGIRRRTAIHFGKVFDLFDRLIIERLQLRKVKGYIPLDDMLDTLLTISEVNNEEMDATRIKHFFLVSTPLLYPVSSACLSIFVLFFVHSVYLLCIKHMFLATSLFGLLFDSIVQQDLFGAGTDTTSSTLEWAMAELLHSPKTLLKARAELERTIGEGNLLEESDITRLPYLQAVIKETLRLHPAVPFLLPHKAGADAEIGGFTVPKNAQVLVNVWAIGRDPSMWEDPNSFVPERFLESGIDHRGQNFEFIPFGSGRRICPGLPLAMRMLPLMLGSLILSFDWKLADGVTPENLNMDDKFGLTLLKAQPLQAIPITRELKHG